MFLEERVRTLEERLAALESSGGRAVSEELSSRLSELEEKGGRLANRTHSLELRIDEIGRDNAGRELAERIDQCESTCHDLLEADESLRTIVHGFDHRVAGFHKQLEGLLEQLAELDGRHSNRDQFMGHEEKIRRIENEIRELQNLRNVRRELTDRLEQMEKSLSQQRSRLDAADAAVEMLRQRTGDFSPITKRLDLVESAIRPISSLTQHIEGLDDQWAALDREELPTRLRAIEERVAAADPTTRLSALTHRLDGVERDSADCRKEITWLRDRPQRQPRDAWSRALGWSGLALGLAAMVLFFWPRTTLTAERFLLVDRGGRVLGDWSNGGQGGSLQLNGSEGRRLALSTGGAGAMLALADETGSDRVRLAVDPSSGHGLMVFDGGGRARMWCGLTHRPAISLFDGDGNLRGALSLEPAGTELAFLESNQHPRVRLTSASGDNGLRVYDNNARLRVGVGMCPEGAAVNLFDPNQHRRVVMSSGSAGSALAFMGEGEIQRTTLGMTEKDESILNLHDRDGHQRVLLFASNEDAGLQVMDRETKVLFSEP